MNDQNEKLKLNLLRTRLSLSFSFTESFSHRFALRSNSLAANFKLNRFP
jgi:hypothetical protein